MSEAITTAKEEDALLRRTGVIIAEERERLKGWDKLDAKKKPKKREVEMTDGDEEARGACPLSAAA